MASWWLPTGKKISRQFCNPLRRGELELKQDHHITSTGFFADTFLDLSAWGKGVAFVNGFNLGWYWPSIGPQNHYYVPGPLLKEGVNDIVLVEMEKAADRLSGKASALYTKRKSSSRIPLPAVLHCLVEIFVTIEIFEYAIQSSTHSFFNLHRRAEGCSARRMSLHNACQHLSFGTNMKLDSRDCLI